MLKREKILNDSAKHSAVGGAGGMTPNWSIKKTFSVAKNWD